MKLFELLFALAFTFSTLGCTTATPIMDESNPVVEVREPAAIVKCASLFGPKKGIKAKSQDEHKKNKIEFVTEFLPASTSEAFWDTVIQLGDNDSKIELATSNMVLTKAYDNDLKIHSTYTFDNASNSFRISKIEYSNPAIKKTLISDMPIDPETNRLKSDLFVDFDTISPGHEDLDISIIDHIDYKIYEKISDELSHLNMFTTYELGKLYKLSPAARSLKYNALSRARTLRKFFTGNILNDYLFAPIKWTVVSVVSVFIVSHVDFVKNVVSKSNHTPEWVAPSIVKMSVAYPRAVQPELVTLMKRIEYQEKSEQPDAKNVQALGHGKKDLIDIDEADQFSIETEGRTNKTYFFVTHQQDGGNIDIYATQIDPTQYPHLIKYFKKTSAATH